jgi:hypothetical protein
MDAFKYFYVMQTREAFGPLNSGSSRFVERHGRAPGGRDAHVDDNFVEVVKNVPDISVPSEGLLASIGHK